MDRREAIKRSGLLTGIGLSAGAIGVLFQACQKANRLDWKPTFLSEDQAASMSAMVDKMLPTTETPGALDLQVDIFVDRMMGASLLPEDQEHVRQGFQNFMADCQAQYGGAFHTLQEADQDTILKELGAKTNTFKVAVWGSPIGEQAPVDFYRRIRQFALLGYFSSEEVGKNVLVYDPIPGEYRGCIPLEEGQSNWTL